MKLDVDFSELKRVADRLGDVRVEFSLGGPELKPLEELYLELKGGVELPTLEQLEFNSAGLLTYKGVHVLLYIKDHGSGIDATLTDPAEGKRFHVCDCRTLSDMKRRKRFDRYVATNDTSGNFIISGRDLHRRQREGSARLLVCINCLKSLNYKNIRRSSMTEKIKAARSFRLDEFFARYSSLFEHLPRFEASAGVSGYNPNWPEVSSHYRASRNWVCEKCHIDLSSNPGLLHVHHRNGVSRDDAASNLVALCADCHSKEPSHGSMYVSLANRRFINKLRGRLRAATRMRPRDDWREVVELADPALHGLLDELEMRGWPPPEVGLEIAHGGRVYAYADLAWPSQKRAVALREDEGIRTMRERGWKVFSIRNLLSEEYPQTQSLF